MLAAVTQAMEELERRIEALRAAVRHAALAGEQDRAVSLRRDLRKAEQEWDTALARLTEVPDPAGGPASFPGRSSSEGMVRGAAAKEPAASAAARPAPSRQEGMLLPLREQVHLALTLLTVPAAPRMVTAVHRAFSADGLQGSRLTSLRRDEERSFRSAPFARPYYICAALTADRLAPARGLLAVSTWPVEQRVIGPLTPRVDFLTAAIQVAESILRLPRPGPAALRLLWRFAANIPGAAGTADAVDPASVVRAAQAERDVHASDDLTARQEAARRARHRLGDAEQLFGTRLRVLPQADASA